MPSREWFAPKRFGYGAGRPIAWQGWAVLLIFAGVVMGSSVAFSATRLPLHFAIVTLAAIALIFVTRNTTRGGWKRRHGERD